MGELFGDKLKKVRTTRNMSQEEFARLLGTSKQVISRYETNQRTPKITIAQEYADKLSIPLNYLIDNGVGAPSPAAANTPLTANEQMKIRGGTFANRLREAMDTAGIKQAELCEKTGIGKSSVSDYLTGNYEPKQKNIIKMAAALNVKPSYLMGVSADDALVNLPAAAPPPLTAKDERQIAKDLENMIDALGGAAAYNDTDDEEDAELLRSSLLTSMRLAKQIAKKKFTPKKYRKE